MDADQPLRAILLVGLGVAFHNDLVWGSCRDTQGLEPLC